MRARVLLVDDEPLILDALRRMLRREPIDVEVTTDPGLALTLVTRGVDVIVSDYRMPAMLGTDFLRAARRAGFMGIGILLTGHADQEVVRRALADGTLDDVIDKPWRDDCLRSAIMHASTRGGRTGLS